MIAKGIALAATLVLLSGCGFAPSSAEVAAMQEQRAELLHIAEQKEQGTYSPPPKPSPPEPEPEPEPPPAPSSPSVGEPMESWI
jgi:hypothetical protein